MDSPTAEKLPFSDKLLVPTKLVVGICHGSEYFNRLSWLRSNGVIGIYINGMNGPRSTVG